MIKRIAGKIIAIMLSVCMMVSIMPAGTVHAEENIFETPVEDFLMKIPSSLKGKQQINGTLGDFRDKPFSAAEVARVQQVNPLTGTTETVSIFALGKQGTDGIFYTAEINMFQPGQGNILTGIHADTVNTRRMTALTVNNGASVGKFTTDNKNLIINS